MLKRNIRLRREYLYKRQQEPGDADRSAKRSRVTSAVAEGRKIPTELRAEARDLVKEAQWVGEDEAEEGAVSRDDELSAIFGFFFWEVAIFGRWDTRGGVAWVGVGAARRAGGSLNGALAVDFDNVWIGQDFSFFFFFSFCCRWVKTVHAFFFFLIKDVL